MVDKQQIEIHDIEIQDNGDVVAQARITPANEGTDASVEVTVAPGHHPVGTRQKIAETVHQAVTNVQGQHLRATVPKGDAELVDEIRGHLSDAQVRAAGATSIIEGDIGSG